MTSRQKWLVQSASKSTSETKRAMAWKLQKTLFDSSKDWMAKKSSGQWYQSWVERVQERIQTSSESTTFKISLSHTRHKLRNLYKHRACKCLDLNSPRKRIVCKQLPASCSSPGTSKDIATFRWNLATLKMQFQSHLKCPWSTGKSAWTHTSYTWQSRSTDNSKSQQVNKRE